MGVVGDRRLYPTNSQGSVYMKAIAALLSSAIVVATVQSAFGEYCTAKPVDDNLSGHYEGECRNGLPHGFGTSTGEMGTYVGEFHNGIVSGRAKAIYPDGHTYEGEFRNGQRHGFGIYTWPHGERHEGQFRNNLAIGYGIHTYADGKRYEGEWSLDRPLGYGIMIGPNGDMRCEGDWRSARFYNGACLSSDGSRVEFRDGEKIVKSNMQDATARIQKIEQRMHEARISCEKWNTPGFFRYADDTVLSRCLKTKNLNAKDDEGRTPMHLAALHSKITEVVATLAKAGVDPNARDKKGRTPLHTAAVFGKTPAVVTALIKAGADLNARDKKGRTPLQFAEKFSKTPAVVAALQKASAPKETRAAARKRRPGTARVSCEKWNTPAFFKSASLADLSRCLKTKNPDARDEKGRTPLHLAAWFGKKPGVVDALLAAGADPAARDKSGKTPWDYAERNAALKDTDVYWRLNEERFR